MNDQFFDLIIIQNELLPKCMCYAIDKMLVKGVHCFGWYVFQHETFLPFRHVLFPEALVTLTEERASFRNKI